MIPFILLIFSQAFASQNLADKIYNCTHQMAKSEASRNTSDPFTVREVTEACRDQVGASHIRVTEAKITEGTTHYIKLAWKQNGKETFRHYAFNLPNSKLCNENDSTTRGVDSLIVDLRDIINNDENSYGKNSCDDGTVKSGITFVDRTFTMPRFGFKKRGTTCKRVCPEGEVMKGTRANVLYKTNNNIVNFGASSGNNDLGEVFLDVQCVKCPYESQDQDMSYSKTSSADNFCYNADGCREGFELLPIRTADAGSKNMYFTVPSINDPKKQCIPKCPPGFAKNINGACEEDEKEICESYKKMGRNAKTWFSNFMKVSQTSSLGSCDMKVIRNHAKKFYDSTETYLKRTIDSACNGRSVAEFVQSPGPNFSIFLAMHHIDEIMPCLNNLNRNSKFDMKLHALVGQDILTSDSNSSFYGSAGTMSSGGMGSGMSMGGMGSGFGENQKTNPKQTNPYNNY